VEHRGKLRATVLPFEEYDVTLRFLDSSLFGSVAIRRTDGLPIPGQFTEYALTDSAGNVFRWRWSGTTDEQFYVGRLIWSNGPGVGF